MTESERLAAEIKEQFDEFGFPEEFLASFDQLECLAHHQNRETFIVRDKISGEICVAKCYSKSEYEIADSLDILTRLDHPGIPLPRGRFENDGMVCFVREYIEGTPLEDYAAERSLSREEVVDICVRLAEILSYLHRQDPPVIHRDIKPENVIIKEDGSVCLIDFDIARTFKDSGEQDTIFFGTKGYAPPEQYGFTQTDSRSDIYSFGVLLRYLLTNSVRANDKITVYRPLQRIIDRCTAFSPEKRYSDADEIIRDLKKANPHAQRLRTVKIVACCLAAACIVGLCGYKIYEKITFNPFLDDSVVASVMPDEERQEEAVKYLQDKYGTHIFDDKEEYMTMALLRQTLIEVYGLDRDYVYAHDTEEPPDESDEWFMPWPIDDYQYVDKDYLAYTVTKLHWPEVIADWSVLDGKKDTGEYPGVMIAFDWCDEHGILIGVNRPNEVSRGDAAVAFANAEKVYEAIEQKSITE